MSYPFTQDGKPSFYQRCSLCRRRYRFGKRPPTLWREVRPPYRIGPSGVPVCGSHWIVPITSRALGARWESTPELRRWQQRGWELWSALGVMHRRKAAGSPARARRQGRPVSGRRSMWGPVYVTATPPLWSLRR